MNSYEEYMESLLELKEQEIALYKEFIERELKCRIREEVYSYKDFDKKNVRDVRCKVVTIPQSQFIIKID